MAGMQVFTNSGTFTPVAGRTYKIVAIGGGFAGNSTFGQPGIIGTLIWTAPNTTAIAVTVGAGGNNVGAVSAGNGVRTTVASGGEATSFGTLLTVNGGHTHISQIVGTNGVNDRSWMDGLVGIVPLNITKGYYNGQGGKGAGAGGYSNYGNTGAVVITWDV